MKRAKQTKRPIVPQPMCDFIEQVMGTKLMPWQRDLVETFAHVAGRRVVYMGVRRNGMTTIRRMCVALRAANKTCQ